MADTKVSALSALAGADVVQTSDVLLIVDTSTTTDKKILVSELSLAMNKLGTQQAGAGATLDFTIPAWATRVTVMCAGLSTNGTTGIMVQLGDAGGIEATGYTGGSMNSGGTITAFSTYFLFGTTAAARIYEAVFDLSLENASAFTWLGQGFMADQSGVQFNTFAGRKSTSAAMTTVRISSVNGTDTFDAGAVNVSYR